MAFIGGWREPKREERGPKGGRKERGTTIGPVPAECDANLIMSALLLALSATGWHGSSVGVLQLQHRLPQPFSHRASPLLMQWDDFDDEEESEPPYTGPPLPEQVQALLLQCAIQTQLSYYNEFKNEMRARWLESFLGHEHLKVERTSDRGGGYAPFRGLSDGLRCSFTEYLKTMLSGKAERYEIRYKIGTADTAGQANPLASAAAEASAGEAAGSSSSEAPWAAASASRAANPYLKQERKEQYKTFTEIVDPRMVAQGLMSICRQISAEWSKDLLAVSRESAYLRGVCGDDGEAYADAFEGGLSGGVSFAADGEGGGSLMPDECDIDVAPQNLLGRDYAAGNVTLDAMCNDQSIGLPVSIPKPAEARRSPPKPARQHAGDIHVQRPGSRARACSRKVRGFASCPLTQFRNAVPSPTALLSLCSPLPSRLPPLIRHRQSVLYASLRATAATWNTDLEETPSPFRAENFDLLQRATTREAVLSALLDLESHDEEMADAVDTSQAASAEWLRAKLDEWLPRFEAPGRSQLAGLFLLDLLSSSPQPRQLSGGGLGMTDPERVAAAVLDHREQIARDWGLAMAASVSASLQTVLQENLEEQLKTRD